MVQVELTGTSVPVVDPNGAPEAVLPGRFVTFKFTLDQAQFLSAYDVKVSFDSAELEFVMLQERYSGGIESLADPGGANPFSATIVFDPNNAYAQSADLFSVTFKVKDALVEDGMFDISWDPNASSLSGPDDPNISNGTQPIGIDVIIPEPSTAVLLGAALAALSLIRRWS